MSERVSTTSSFPWWQRGLSWAVHLFTASGLLAALSAVIAMEHQQWRTVFVWMLVALVIDGVDGTFARWLRVTEVLPRMDGKTIDYVVDFVTYAVVPALLLYYYRDTTGQYLVPQSWRYAAAGAVLLTSAMYYGKSGMVSADYYFVGFPVLWNLVLFYLAAVVRLDAGANLAVVAVLCVLHFVPVKYVYPSRTPDFKVLGWIALAGWAVSVVAVWWLFPAVSAWASGGALLSAALLFGIGLYASLKPQARNVVSEVNTQPQVDAP